jgi:hypothetical protein
VYAEVLLRELPREGDEFDYHGRFWGGRDAAGPVTRLEINVGNGGFSRHFLIQGGPDPSVWLWDPAESPAPVAGAILKPLAPRLVMTPFDVLPMPYLFWLDADLAGTGQIRGRRAHMFVLSPSADFRAANPSVAAVRVYLDTQYDALVQSEVVGASGAVAKTLSLLDLKKVGDRWIPKDLDVRDERTRDKTRLSITAVSVGADPGAAAFDPARLGEALQAPAHLERVP